MSKGVGNVQLAKQGVKLGKILLQTVGDHQALCDLI